MSAKLARFALKVLSTWIVVIRFKYGFVDSGKYQVWEFTSGLTTLSSCFLLLHVRGRTWFLVVNDVMTRKVIFVIFHENDRFTPPVVAPSPNWFGFEVGLRKS